MIYLQHYRTAAGQTVASRGGALFQVPSSRTLNAPRTAGGLMTRSGAQDKCVDAGFLPRPESRTHQIQAGS